MQKEKRSGSPAQSGKRKLIFAIYSKEQENWRDENANRDPWHEHSHINVFHSKTLQDASRCSFCPKYLIGPIFYASRDPYMASCGRCVRRKPSLVRKYDMVRDHVYAKLMPYFFFECSHKPCEQRLKWHQVEEHERDCVLKSQTRPEDHGSCLLKKYEDIFVAIPKATALRRTLSCDLCNKLLSVFPVVSNGEIFLCGRCQRPEPDKWTEQKVYSRLAQHVKFPCSNLSCTQFLKVDEVEDHEKNCRWTSMPCPCCGKVKLEIEMSLHIRHHHLHHQQADDRLEVKPQTSLLKLDDDPYIVSIATVGERQFSCAVYGLDDKEYDDVHVEIVDGKSDAVLESLPVRVTRTLLNRQLDESTNRVHIKAQRNKNEHYLRLATIENATGVALDEESRDKMECKVCYSYMTGSIYKCVNRHPICSGCRARVVTCPMCRDVLVDDRYLELEKEAANLKFPCALQESNGCDVALVPKFLTRHEAACRPRQEFSCLIETCKVNKLSSDRYEYLFNHFARHHLDSMMYSGSQEVLLWSDKEPIRRRVLFFDGIMFTVWLAISTNGGVYVCVTQLEPEPVSKRYKYTVELHGNGRIVEMKATCTLLLRTPNLYVEPEAVEDMLNVGPTCTVWLNFRLKLEADE